MSQLNVVLQAHRDGPGVEVDIPLDPNGGCTPSVVVYGGSAYTHQGFTNDQRILYRKVVTAFVRRETTPARRWNGTAA